MIRSSHKRELGNEKQSAKVVGPRSFPDSNIQYESNMKTLGICGDSFMAATINGDGSREDIRDSEGKHFTEILAEKIGYDYFTLARGAASNTAIRLQIDEMIKQKVDLVIIGTTTPNRLEIPYIGKTFDTDLGVYNLDYRTEYYPDKSTLNPKFRHNMLTDTLTNIFYDPSPFHKKIFNDDCRGHVPQISQNQLDALGNYIDYLYDTDYKQMQDAWAIHSGIKALEENNIPFIVIWNIITPIGVDTSNDHRFIHFNHKLNPTTWELGHRRWHTTDEAQAIGAESWYTYLLDNGYLNN